MKSDFEMLKNIASISDLILDKLTGFMVRLKHEQLITFGEMLIFPKDIQLHEDDKFEIISARLRTINNQTLIRITINLMGNHVLVDPDMIIID